MNRFLSKISIALFTLLISIGMSFALEEEYKNSLEKVELIKTGDSTYSINLYTQKEYKEPVKVIKKSDLNYYILLPETKNSASQTASNSNEIRSLTTNSYSYAGANVKNGYTKINISTTKPVNFKIVAKTNTPKTANQDSVAIQTSKDEIGEVQEPIQKKNSIFQKENTNSQTSDTKIKLKEPKAILTAQTAKKNINGTSKNRPQIAAAAKIADNQPDTQPQAQETSAVNPDKMVDLINEEIEKNRAQNQIPETKMQEEFAEEDIPNDYQSVEFDDYSPIEDPTASNAIEPSLKTEIKNKLKQYGITKKDIMWMFLVSIISLFALIAIFSKKQANPKIYSKSDLMENEDYPQKQPSKRNDQYFVFDKNIKQTGLCAPCAKGQEKNYQLSSYNPELRINNKRSPQISKYISGNEKKKSESEYDIIQKILKEDNSVNTAGKQFHEKIKTQKINQTEPKIAPLKQEEKKETTAPIKEMPKTIQPKKNEPFVLSKIEIAPGRGFMCVGYNNNISLMGYIFDDVFVLHNFKTKKLENYDIKYRLNEKNNKSSDFIVRIDKTKLLIKVTQNTMSKEIVM